MTPASTIPPAPNLSTIVDTEGQARALSVRPVSFFPNVWAKAPDRDRPLGEILEEIRAGVYRAPVQRLRTLPADEYDRAKRSLPAFVPSGTCRDRKTPLDHSGLLQVDIDDLEPASLGELRRRLRQDPHVAFGFVSPSGAGLKLGVAIDGAHHAESFTAAETYFATNYGAAMDPKTKDRLRLCFVSDDPELWVSENPKILPCNVTESVDVILSTDSAYSADSVTSCADSVTDAVRCSAGTVFRTQFRRLCADSVTDAVRCSLPSGPGQNNASLFRLARALLTAGLTTAPDRVRAFNLWHDMTAAAGVLRHSKDDYFLEFMHAVDTAKKPLGPTPVDEALTRAQAEPPPPGADLVVGDTLKLALAVCWHLSDRGKVTFYISCRDLGRVIGLPPEVGAMRAHRILRGFVALKLLEVAEPGTAYRATRYHWKGAQ